MMLIPILGRSAAHAQLPAESSNVRLLGRGLLDRNTGESIALACKDENCDTIGLLYAKKGQASWVGNTFPAPVYEGRQSDGSEIPGPQKLMRYALKLELTYFMALHNPYFAAEEYRRDVRYTEFVPLAGVFHRSVHHYEGLFEKAGFDQNGWNWSSKAKPTKSSVVQRYLFVFKHPPIQTMCSNLNDILELKAHCYQKGVRFHDGAELFITNNGKSNYSRMKANAYSPKKGDWIYDD